MKREAYLVSIVRPPGVSIRDMERLIMDAVGTWGKSLHPPGAYGPEDEGDPCFAVGDDEYGPIVVNRMTPKKVERLHEKGRFGYGRYAGSL